MLPHKILYSSPREPSLVSRPGRKLSVSGESVPFVLMEDAVVFQFVGIQVPSLQADGFGMSQQPPLRELLKASFQEQRFKPLSNPAPPK